MGTFRKHFKSRLSLYLLVFSLSALSACSTAGVGSQTGPGTDAGPGVAGNEAEADENVRTLSNPAPRYPELARGRGHEGTVLVEAVVDERGVPTGVRLKESSGHGLLDEAAVAAVKKWRFSPARSGGKTVSTRVIAPIEFRLLKSGIPGGKPHP
jgi:protein TonB